MARNGPNLRLAGEPARRVPTGGAYQPDNLAYEIPDDLPGEEFDETDGGKLAKRLIIAFVLIAAIALVNILVLRRFDMDLHPMVLFGAFGVILFSSVLSAIESKPKRVSEETSGSEDMGCAVGCCQGPRPIGELSRKAQQRRNQMRLPTRQPKQ